MSSKICYKEKELAEMHANILYIKEKLDDYAPEIKENTAFRNKATGMAAFVGIIFGFVGSGILWILNKFWK